MRRLYLPLILAALCAGLLLPASGSASEYAAGVLSFDPATSSVPGPGQFDIQNLTGAASAAPDFPITTSLTFTLTSVTLDFSDGSSEILSGSHFTSDGFGGFTGNDSFNTTGAGPFVTEAILAGTVSPSAATVSGVGAITLTGLTATLTDPSGGPLQLFDSTDIYATTGKAGVVPEPGSLWLMAAFLGVLALVGTKAAITNTGKGGQCL